MRRGGGSSGRQAPRDHKLAHRYAKLNLLPSLGLAARSFFPPRQGKLQFGLCSPTKADAEIRWPTRPKRTPAPASEYQGQPRGTLAARPGSPRCPPEASVALTVT